MLGNEVRASFLSFFRSRGHEVVASASIVPAGDPTLMFTNAGMVQFKDIFLGNTEAAHSRVANSQKCLRISGKHNDLEEVGRDTYHHTLFEMLGNWSFGDYYKAEAIEGAWQLLTDEWGLPKDRLYASVYASDDESAGLWKRVTDIDEKRILSFDSKDNFWEMGDTGPCGPCSEIHIDRGAGACDARGVKGHVCAVNGGCARFIEIWNLVFIQHSRDAAGDLHDLPSKHVDTGMGLERVAAVLENVDGNYDGSLLRGIISAAEELSGRSYGKNEDDDVSLRVLADHGRAVSFMIADGIEPSNEGRGYVLRRLLRRAARHGKNLGLDEPFLYKLSQTVAGIMGQAYPELGDNGERIADCVRDEEERFGQTLERGLVHLDEAVAGLGAKATVLPGEVAFRLYDTYGFPVDMTEDILRSRGLTVDRQGFDSALDLQRERARGAKGAKGVASDFTLLVANVRGQGGTQFTGPADEQSCSAVLALASAGSLADRATEGEEVDVVTAATPFYGESGGQVGDTGTITTDAGAVLEVFDTQRPAPDVTVHRARVASGQVTVGEQVSLSIDATRRQAIRLNHSATHLLHAALRNHLGPSVGQAGSLVEASRLRFDFSHDGQIADEKLADIESEVNDVIRSNLEVGTEEMPYKEAIERGAIAFFGEKYGEVVRVVAMGDYSVELCGGTHVRRTGDIGVLRLGSQGGVAAGVRRVEAYTGRGALDEVRRREAILCQVSDLLRSGEEETAERVEKLLATLRQLEKKAASAAEARSGDVVGDLAAAAREIEGTRAVVARVDGVESKVMRSVSDRVRERLGSCVVVLVGESDAGISLTVAVTDDQTVRFHAGKIISQLTPFIDGRGGGKADFAQGGGKDPAGIGSLLEKANELLV